MAHILQYTNGILGYGLSNDLDTAMEEAVDRCMEVGSAAKIVDRKSFVVLAEIRPTVSNPTLYKAKKVDNT